jgi:hypothetical protein
MEDERRMMVEAAMPIPPKEGLFYSPDNKLDLKTESVERQNNL